MKFNSAYQLMLKGCKIRRRGWGGYWYINDNGQLVIHLKNGKELIDESSCLNLTIENTLKDDWEEVE